MPKRKVKSTPTDSKKSSSKSVAPPAPSKAEETTAPASTTPQLQEQFAQLLTQLSVLRSQLTAVTSQVRTLSKRTERELKQAQKVGRKKRKSGNRAPSGFVKPTRISNELAAFLGKNEGSEMARTEVTREINHYIREHKLQDPKNGRHILADSKLKKLLKLKKGDELTYFNLQRFMSPHFAKASSKTTAQ
tara:strand:+ start:430 stop:999 length:570 start_codon:yes stop_codon:yes gene_type:complete